MPLILDSQPDEKAVNGLQVDATPDPKAVAELQGIQWHQPAQSQAQGQKPAQKPSQAQDSRVKWHMDIPKSHWLNYLNPVGGLESAAHAVTGALASTVAPAVGVVGGLAQAAGAPVNAQKAMQGTQEALTYQPHTESGQQISSGVDTAMGAAGAIPQAAGNLAGEAVKRVGGNEGLQTAANATAQAAAGAVEGIATGGMVHGAKRIMGRAKAAGEAYKTTVNPEHEIQKNRVPEPPREKLNASASSVIKQSNDATATTKFSGNVSDDAYRIRQQHQADQNRVGAMLRLKGKHGKLDKADIAELDKDIGRINQKIGREKASEEPLAPESAYASGQKPEQTPTTKAPGTDKIKEWVNARNAERLSDYLNNLTQDPNFGKIGKVAKDAPKGWRTVDMPQLHGFALEPKTADTLDRWHKELQHSKDPHNVLEKAGHLITSSMFYNPLPHMANVFSHWMADRGLVSGWVSPKGYYRLLKDGSRAVVAVTSRNQDYIDALDHGGAMMYSGTVNRDFYKGVIKKLHEQAAKDPQMGFLKGTLERVYKNTLGPVYKGSNRAMWGFNDILMMERYYEEMDKGRSYAGAIHETEKGLPNYRMPERLMGSKLLGDLANNPAVSAFNRYHYGMLKSWSNAIKEAFGPGVPKGERLAAYDKLMMMGVITYVIYPNLDKLAVAISGNQDAHFRRAGVATIPDTISKTMKGEETPGSAVTSIATPSPMMSAALELLFNKRLYSGAQVYNKGDSTGKKVGKSIGRAAEAVAPIGDAKKYLTSTNPDKTGKDWLLRQLTISTYKPKPND